MEDYIKDEMSGDLKRAMLTIGMVLNILLGFRPGSRV